VKARARLQAALGFLALEPRAPELQLLHRCFDSWRGIGDIVTGMTRQGYQLHLTNTEPSTGARQTSRPVSLIRSSVLGPGADALGDGAPFTLEAPHSPCETLQGLT
jgi:hypothetical protein